MAEPQPKPSEDGSTVGGIAPIPSLAEVHPVRPPRGAVWFTVCAWCNQVEVRGRWVTVQHLPDPSDGSGVGSPLVTHGICPSCFDQAIREAEQARRRRDEA